MRDRSKYDDWGAELPETPDSVDEPGEEEIDAPALDALRMRVLHLVALTERARAERSKLH